MKTAWSDLGSMRPGIWFLDAALHPLTTSTPPPPTPSPHSRRQLSRVELEVFFYLEYDWITFPTPVFLFGFSTLQLQPDIEWVKLSSKAHKFTLIHKMSEPEAELEIHLVKILVRYI